jgi:hypothetical protein
MPMENYSALIDGSNNTLQKQCSCRIYLCLLKKCDKLSFSFYMSLFNKHSNIWSGNQVHISTDI